jgi:hypothetical protein
MVRTETYFEQVPKSVIEKILARQNTKAEVEIGETHYDGESSAIEDKNPDRPTSKR